MEIAEAYEAGYRDGSINYELEHCPACKNVADLQEALAENAKLREEFDKMDVWHSKELTAAMAENAKLRKLVADEEDEPHECYFKWSLADNGWADHTCSKCGFVENTDIHVVLDWNYCPNCGRKVVSK